MCGHTDGRIERQVDLTDRGTGCIWDGEGEGDGKSEAGDVLLSLLVFTTLKVSPAVCLEGR